MSETDDEPQKVSAAFWHCALIEIVFLSRA